MPDKPSKKADKYSAVWVSHSSIGDFLKCPRLYYLHNVYKDPETTHKISTVSPATSLGQAVHEVLEGLIRYKAEDRMSVPFKVEYDMAWAKIAGKMGGFTGTEQENDQKERGWQMIEKVIKNPGPLIRKAIKLPDHPSGMPPNFYLSEDDNIILCGKIDWLEYLPEDDAIKVLDFKTGKREESDDSLQLPIYLLLLNALQKRKVAGASYWYLETDDEPRQKELPDAEEAHQRVLEKALLVKEARDKKEFKCPHGKDGCIFCRPFEKILRGEAEFLGVGEMRQDLYLVE